MPKHNITNVVKITDKSTMTDLSESKAKKRNIVIKFLADQVIGGTVNSLAFIAFFAFIDGRDVTPAVKNEFWPMRVASLKLWPAVSAITVAVQQAIHVDNPGIFRCHCSITRLFRQSIGSSKFESF